MNTDTNVDPGLINPWLLLIGGCPLLVRIQTTFGGITPPIVGRVLLRSWDIIPVRFFLFPETLKLALALSSLGRCTAGGHCLSHCECHPFLEDHEPFLKGPCGKRSQESRLHEGSPRLG